MAVSNISAHALGKLMVIDFSSRVKYQLTSNVKDFENFKQSYGVDDKAGKRSFEFPLQTSAGPNAVQAAAADGSTSNTFPAGQEEEVGFYEGVYKQIDTTLEVSLDLWQRAMDDPSYNTLNPLMLASKSKAIASKKEMCIFLHGDGTGRRGIVSSVSYASGAITITLAQTSSDIGHAGWMQIGELVYIMANTATISAGAPSATIAAGTSSGTAVYYKVTGRNLRNGTVTLGKAYSSADAELTINGVGSVVATNVLYKKGQITGVATDSAPSGDYNTLTEVGAGLESILANDGRTVHGITMSGAVAGTHYTASGTFDPQHVQEGLTDVKTAADSDGYSYSQLIMAPKIIDVFVEGLNTDMVVRSEDPKKRGAKAAFYQHEEDMVKLSRSEFCPNNRIRCLPEGMGGEDGPLEWRGTEFKKVSIGGVDMFPGVNSSGEHKKSIKQYSTSRYVFVSKHPAACLTISGYDQP